uniref:Uncharacterized protein n=1 Tax=Arundo donax TaxID=35708 RepID=A0A0A9B8N1_ARUDO
MKIITCRGHKQLVVLVSDKAFKVLPRHHTASIHLKAPHKIPPPPPL